MSFTAPPTANVTISLIDGSGTPGKVQLHVASTALVADVKTAVTALIPLLGGISDCTVLGYTITYAVQETSPIAPSELARVENKGVFTFNLANTLETRIEVPGIKSDVLVDTGSIDVTLTAVSDFLDAIIASPAIFRGIGGEDIVSISTAFQRFRRSTPNMLPSNRKKFGA